VGKVQEGREDELKRKSVSEFINSHTTTHVEMPREDHQSPLEETLEGVHLNGEVQIRTLLVEVHLHSHTPQ